MKVHWRMLSSVIVCVMLVTGLLSPLRANRAAISATPEVASQPETAGLPLRLAAGTFDPLQEAEPGSTTQALHLEAYPAEGMGYYLVQFQGPIASSDVDALKATGADVFDYIPDFAFIVKMDNAARAAVEQQAQIRWVGLYQPAYRLSPELLTRAIAVENTSAPAIDASLTLVVSVFRGETVAPVASAIQSLRGVILDQSQTSWQSKFKVTVPASVLAELASIPGVRWIETAPQWRLYNEQSDNIMGVREVWDTHGLYGGGQTVAVCDTGLDQGSSMPASLHNDFENGSGVSRVLTIYDRVGDGASDVNSGHGTHVSGSVLGNGDLSGATPASHTYPESAYVGMAPEASLIFQAVEDNTTGDLSGIPFDLNTLFLQADTAGADLHTNSWGSNDASAYTTDSEAVDEYIWDHKDFTIFFSAGNEGTDANSNGVVDLYSMGSPATAKNSVTVGASENNRPTFTYTWAGAWPADFPASPINSDYMADDITGLAAFSSRGPVLDYRYKPDVVAPGTFIASTRSSMASETGWGEIDANYMYMGGTSMATPLTAGAAAIVRQYYTDVRSYTPSAALIKATLINGATDIYPGQYGTSTTQEIPTTRPTNVAGWGRVNIQNSIFPTAPRAMTYEDQITGLSTGASDVYTYQITSSAEPFRVTLAWTDYPGSPAANGALVNDLDLTITGPSGTIYYPNNALASGGTPSATYDRVNNLEGIDIASPTTGVYTVTVSGYSVPQGPQPYAMVVSGIFPMVNTAPTLSGLPDQALSPGASKNNAIDLWTYASDDLDADSVMTFTITNSPPLTVGVTIDSHRYIDIAPTGSFTGTFPVVVEVMDTGGLTDTDTFNITFAEIQTRYVYLPLVLRNHPLPPELPTEFDAVEDADISQAYPTTNNGASASMYVGYDDLHDPDWQILRSLIKFDVSEIPASTSISSAVLRVYYAGYYDYANYSRTITSYRIGSNWSEASVTWNTAPSIGETYGTVSLIAASSSFGWYSIDVTNLVRGWINGTLPNYGVMLRGPEHSGSDSSWRSFATKEAGSSYTPYLQITYTTMAATEGGPDTVAPIVGSIPSSGTQSSKRLVTVSMDPLCDVFGCVAP